MNSLGSADRNHSLIFESNSYLRTYSEPEAALAHWWGQLNKPQPDCVLVIPSCAESKSVDPCIQSAITSANALNLKLLIILVINHSLDACEATKSDNLLTLEQLKPKTGFYLEFPGPFKGYSLTLEAHECIVVDRASAGHELPPKQGVGLARKIGSDIACAMHFLKLINTAFAHTTDADAIVPRDYFLPTLSATDPLPSAFVYPFEHAPMADMNQNQQDAVSTYHNYLINYRDGLKAAGSPYGFHTIGSTIAFNIASYALVRGFPKKAAGEDFYLLNKLRKLAPVYEANSGPVLLQGRLSERVPFGTGQSILEISSLIEQGKEWKTYPEWIFERLKSWLTLLDEYCEHKDLTQFKIECSRTVTGSENTTDKLLDHLKMRTFLNGLPTKSRTTEGRKNHVLTWFDALKTLRFVHFWKESGRPSVSHHKLSCDAKATKNEQ